MGVLTDIINGVADLKYELVSRKGAKARRYKEGER
jgi:hypothetical protein